MIDSPKFPVIQIQLDGAEVPDSPKATAASWDEANAILAEWGKTAPPKGRGYHKVDFLIRFANGIEYGGRFDLQQGGRESDGATLQAHVYDFALCYAGRRRPFHVSPAAYQALLERIGEDERTFYAQVLDSCDLGPEPPPPLVSAGEDAREAGFRYPVFLTRDAWNHYVAIPKGVRLQEEPGRLWDILWMLRHAIKKQGGARDFLDFEVYVRNDNRAPRPVHLRSRVGPGDTPDPVIIIGTPEEIEAPESW